MTLIEIAKKYRLIIEYAMQFVDDKIASEAPTLFPRCLKNDSQKELPAGFKLYWKGKILKSKIPLWDTEQYDPDHNPDNWQEIKYSNGIRIIPEFILTTESFSKNEKGLWKNIIWISKVNNNVYNPDQYPDNWIKNI